MAHLLHAHLDPQISVILLHVGLPTWEPLVGWSLSSKGPEVSRVTPWRLGEDRLEGRQGQ